LYWGFAVGLPLVGMKILDRDQRERHSKGYTRHEVTAARAAALSSRTADSLLGFCKKYRDSSPSAQKNGLFQHLWREGSDGKLDEGD
jgi:HKD family nuclease